MAKIYAELVKKGLRTIEQVPEKLRDEVRRILGIAKDKTEPKAKSGPPSVCPDCGSKGSLSIEWDPITDISVCRKCGWTNKP